jgi:hypothetical protein
LNWNGFENVCEVTEVCRRRLNQGYEGKEKGSREGVELERE